MAPKPRLKANKGLPSGWRHKHGAYYYRPPVQQRELWDGKTEFRLGKTQNEAYRVWSERLELHADARTVGDLLDRYALEVVPEKAEKTQKSNYASIGKLKRVFGKMPIGTVQSRHAYGYLDVRGKQGKTAANRDYEVLSHAFTMAIKWGLIEDHPFKGKVIKHRTPPRNRYIEDWELEEALKVASPFLVAYIRLKLLTGLRKGDLLSLKHSQLREEGIFVTPQKTEKSTGRKFTIKWNDDLRFAVDEVISLQKKVSSIWLFHTNKGQPYIKPNGSTSGFDSNWQRFMAAALSKTNLQDRFTEHDLRAKGASDSNLVHAQQLLGHSSPEVTRRNYMRGTEVVEPFSRKQRKP